MSPLDISLELAESAAVLPVDVSDANQPADGNNHYLEAEEGYGSRFFFDAFGSNTPSYGLDTVVITGTRMTNWWSFGATYVDYGEYLAINEGGGGSGGYPSHGAPCGSRSGQQVDWDFIQEREGNTTIGYVPTSHGAPIGHSGVTIASGFDLGSHSMRDLNNMGLSNALVAELRPYIGLTGHAALWQLAVNPLSISSAEANEINQASHAQTLGSLVVRYDSATGQDGDFYKLPTEAQTVIASVAFQYGNLAAAAPSFWSDVVQKDWSGAVAELRNFHDDFATRRNLEADLLQGALIDNHLHNGSNC